MKWFYEKWIFILTPTLSVQYWLWLRLRLRLWFCLVLQRIQFKSEESLMRICSAYREVLHGCLSSHIAKSNPAFWFPVVPKVNGRVIQPLDCSWITKPFLFYFIALRIIIMQEIRWEFITFRSRTDRVFRE